MLEDEGEEAVEVAGEAGQDSSSSGEGSGDLEKIVEEGVDRSRVGEMLVRPFGL